MVIYCVVGACDRNQRDDPTFSFYSMPKDKAVRRQWEQFVNGTRSDFQPSAYSRLCQAHFNPKESFTQTCLTKLNLGLSVPFMKLRAEAVPTEESPFLRQCEKPPQSAPSSSSTSTNVDDGNTADDEDKPLKRSRRRNVGKRQRELETMLEPTELLNIDDGQRRLALQTHSSQPEDNGQEEFHFGCVISMKRACFDQDSKTIKPVKTKKKSKALQVNIASKMCSRGQQWKPKTRNVTVQCEVVKLPDLTLLTGNPNEPPVS